MHGNGSDLVWSYGGDYAVKENFSVKAFEGSTNAQLFDLSTDYVVEALYGGPLLYLHSYVLLFKGHYLMLCCRMEIIVV